MIGRGGLTRAALLDGLAEAGGEAPRSYISTGNLTFGCPPARLGEVAAALEEVIEQMIGRHEPVFTWSVAELAGLAGHADFDDPRPVHERCVTFLSPGTRWVEELPFTTARDDLTLTAATDGAVFSVTREVGGRPGNPGRLIERELGTRVTTRNWNTVERILSSPGP